MNKRIQILNARKLATYHQRLNAKLKIYAVTFECTWTEGYDNLKKNLKDNLTIAAGNINSLGDYGFEVKFRKNLQSIFR